MERKRGRKSRYGAGYAIEHAERLFRQSVDEKRPDYKFVALAIGAAPASPPSWAIFECIQLRQREERNAGRGHEQNVSDILDDVVRFYDRAQRNFEDQCRNTSATLDDYSPPSLAKAIRQVLAEREERQDIACKVDGDWFRDVRNAWNLEQKNDLAPSAIMHLDEGKAAKKRGGFLKTTHRIARVLQQSMAQEIGHPEDLATWAWTTKRIIEQQAIAEKTPYSA